MKMAAGFLLRRAAGMKHSGPIFRWNARQLEFLEQTGRHCGDMRRILDVTGCDVSRFTNPSVGGIGLELKGEKFERQLGELAMANGWWPMGDQLAQTRAKI